VSAFHFNSGTDCILGTAVLATEAAELVHLYVDLMNAGAPYTVIRDAVYIHPTLAEAVQSASLKSLARSNKWRVWRRNGSKSICKRSRARAQPRADGTIRRNVEMNKGDWRRKTEGQSTSCRAAREST
jgi:hypothetical protein